MEPTAAAVPRPMVDEESAFFWDALAQHRLLLQRCTACGRHRFPPMPSCPWCAAPDADVVESAGVGDVYSWVTVHRPLGDAFADDVPYMIATVTLADGGRVFARLEADAAVVRAGLPVAACFVDHDAWTELRFQPAGAER